MYMNFGVLHAPLPKKILHLVSYQMLDFTSFFKSKLISIYDFWGCIENWQGNYFLMFFPTDAGEFTCLAGFFSFMWEILHACRESGRNSVQAGDSLSMRESWKPCIIFLVRDKPIGALARNHTLERLKDHLKLDSKGTAVRLIIINVALFSL